MEFRIEKAACFLVALALAAVPAAAEETFRVRHEHLRKGCVGTLTVSDAGIAFDGAKKHKFSWSYTDIQQLEIAPREIRVLTYKDDKWKLGADREYRFSALQGQEFGRAYALLKDRLDQRFVAALADEDVEPLFELPAKHLERFGGTEGVLIFGGNRIVYRSAKESRTWRYADVDSISTSGPFQFTLTTFERARTHYGGLKGYNFQLKQPLDEDRYNDLWRRLNLKKGTIK